MNGITSNNIEYKLFDGSVIQCFNSQSHQGLPCFEQGVYEDDNHNDIDLHYSHVVSSSSYGETPREYPTPSMSSSIPTKPTIPTTTTSIATRKPSQQPSISPTPTPTEQEPFLCPMDNNNDIDDICIAFDQSCGLSSTECDIYLDLIAQFIESMKHGNNPNPRLCLLGVSSGVQILIPLSDTRTIDEILDLISKQTCGDSSTNLLDALEIAQFKFNRITPKSDHKSLVIFNSCVSTDSNGNFNEDDICNEYNSIQTKSNTNTNTNTYIINIQSLDGSSIGKTNFLPSGTIDPNTYLQCLTQNNPNRMVSITQNNYQNAYGIIDDISKQICNDHNVIINAGSNSLMNIDMVNIEESKSHGNVNGNKGLSETTLSVIKFVFVFVMMAIVCNAICCGFFALRQSGSLDSCFGAIHKEEDDYSTNYEDSDDSTTYEDEDIDSDSDEDDYDSPPIPENIDNDLSDIKLKKYLNEIGHGPFSKYNNNRTRHLKQNAQTPLELSIYIQDLNLSEIS
mmetsp:Transcript_25005/g.21865  ORF Transcript_25005/g.21865 Transcript_25005/m.21865 type:complete len:509 (-) Transcript_25005:43-1569(-)